MPTLHDLPQDVLDHVLLALPDFDALAAAVLSSRLFYDVFAARPRSTVLAIAYNLVGPALPQAVAALHGSFDGVTGLTVVEEPLAHYVYVCLKENANVVARFEDLFSLRHKDRTSLTSRLDEAESLRFRRALYTFWLYSANYKCDEDEDNQLLLKTLPTDQLLELECIVDFLKEVIQWITNSCPAFPYADVPSGVYFMNGPGHLWMCYDECICTEGHIDDHEPHFDTQFPIEMCSRGLSDEQHQEQLAKAVLDQVCGNQDTCHRCDAVKGVHLWGRNNWHLLRDFLSVRRLAQVLEGHLPRNLFEEKQMYKHICHRDEQDVLTFSWSDFMEELCDMNIDAEGPWDKTQWYCIDCILALLRLRFRKWWITTKIRVDGPLKPDCWYGYNCRTQTNWRSTHAERLNHLCEPTRGDGVETEPQ